MDGGGDLRRLGFVLAVRVGRPADLPYRGGTVRSSIRKEPVDGPVTLRKTNLDGDAQADLSVHGGPDKAVYLYSAADYEWWRAELGRDLPDGIFGENLTVDGEWIADVTIGDRFGVGGAVVQATEPREPCFKLGAVMEDQAFLKRFRQEGRTGFYARVLQEGPVAPGDAVTPVTRGADGNLTIAELHDLYVNGRKDHDRLRAALVSPDLTEGWRDWARKRIEEIERA